MTRELPALPHAETTGLIIGAYYDVYNHTSKTYPEYLYERIMIMELEDRGLSVTQQDEYNIMYKGTVLGKQILDLYVASEVVIENKVVEHLSPKNMAQCLSYMKTIGRNVGLLLNFGSDKPEFKRIFFDRDDAAIREQAPPLEDPKKVSDRATNDWLYPELTYKIVSALYEVHNTLGPEFVHRIY